MIGTDSAHVRRIQPSCRLSRASNRRSFQRFSSSAIFTRIFRQNEQNGANRFLEQTQVIRQILFILSKKTPEPGQQPALVLARQLVLPDANYFPALRPQRAVHDPVAGLVGGNLPPPKRRIALRLDKVPRAAVPKTTVNEDGESLRPKNKIRPHRKPDPALASNLPPSRFCLLTSDLRLLISDHRAPPPAGDAVRTHERDE